MRGRRTVVRAALAMHALVLLSCQRTVTAYPDELAGVGVVVQRTATGHAISRVISNGPAAAAGLAAGDEILAVNGEPTDGKSLASVVASLRGKPGSQVVVRVRGTRGDLTVTVTRKQMEKNGANYRVE